MMPVPSSRRRAWPWIAGALAVKLAMAAGLLIAGGGATSGRLYRESTDTPTYLRPAEELLRGGGYTSNPGDPAGAFRRVPGYPLTYLMLRLLAPPEAAKSLLVVLQVLLSGISVYCLARTAEWVLGPGVFAIVFVLYAASSFVSVWDVALLTESLSVSALILAVYALVRYQQGGAPGWLLGASLWITYAAFLRSSLLPLAGLLGILLLAAPGSTRRDRLRAACVFVSLPSIATAAWLGRNYARAERMLPPETNYWLGVDVDLGPGHPGYPGIKDVQFHAYRWGRAVGGDIIASRPRTLGAWLHEDSPYASTSLPEAAQITTSSCPEPVLQEARADFNRFLAMGGKRASEAGRALGRRVIATFDRCYEEYRHAHPLRFWVGNRLRLLRDFVGHSGTVYLPLPSFPELWRRPAALLVKALSGLLYWLTLVLGLAAVPGLLRRSWPARVLFVAVPAYVLVLFPLLLRLVDIRFLVSAYPWLAGGAAWVLARARGRWRGVLHA